MGWDPAFPGREAVIEVYPAGTLVSRGLSGSGYKTPGHRKERELIVAMLRQNMRIAIPEEAMLGNDHVLDSVLCALAGQDFLAGRCFKPTDHDLARKEGWIWVRRPERDPSSPSRQGGGTPLAKERSGASDES
jgi:hypothetical protein